MVFVEFAVNGGYPQGMEGIVRKIKEADSHTDICFLYAATVGQLAAYEQGKVLPHIAELEKLANYYQIPSVHMALFPALLVKYGKLVPKGDPAKHPDQLVFTQDGTHPLVSGGNLYAGAIGRMMEATLQLTKSGKETNDRLPEPLYIGNWEDAGWVDPEKAARFSEGWKKIPLDGNLSQFAGWFPSAMSAGNPGEYCTVEYDGDAIGLFDIGGPEVGQLKIELDGKAVKVRSAGGVRLNIVDGGDGQTVINRFNVNCNNRYRGQFFVLLTSPGRHKVRFVIDKDIPDKRAILGKSQWEDIDKNPDKYDHQNIYIAKVLVKGKILDEN